MDETIRRLKAFADVGAECLYAPGISTREQISAVVKGVAPKPVNLLVGGPLELTVTDIAGLGVRRISVGGALARAAWGGFIRTAKLIAEGGSFKGFADAAPGAEIMKGLKGSGCQTLWVWHLRVTPTRRRTPSRCHPADGCRT